MANEVVVDKGREAAPVDRRTKWEKLGFSRHEYRLRTGLGLKVVAAVIWGVDLMLGAGLGLFWAHLQGLLTIPFLA